MMNEVSCRNPVEHFRATLHQTKCQRFPIQSINCVPPFNRRIYEIVRAVPPRSTLTYGEIAARLGGGPELARDVGTAMGQNPFPPIVPCHRVVAANRKAGGFSARGGVDTKLRLLAIEGAQVDGTLPLFDRAAPR